jgi:hypothetical protein
VEGTLPALFQHPLLLARTQIRIDHCSFRPDIGFLNDFILEQR